jgi:hypothetical protein
LPRPQLYINTDKHVERLFIEISAARGSKITSANPAPMDKSDKRMSWIADVRPTRQYRKITEKRRLRDRAEPEPKPDPTKSISSRTDEAFAVPPLAFDPRDENAVFVTGPAQLTVPLPTSEIVTSDKMHIQINRLSYESIGPGEGAHMSHAHAEEVMVPPMRYHAPMFPPVGPPVVGECFEVASCDLRRFLKRSLTALRLPRTQARKFMRYWLPAMQIHPWCLVRFLPDSDTIEQVVGKITMLPEPASLRRVFMVWQGIPQRVRDTPFSHMHHDKFEEKKAMVPAATPEGQDLERIADACLRVYDLPPWPPQEDPTLTPALKAEHPDYGYVQMPNGLWAYTLIVDEKAKPAIMDVVEFGGACLNDLTPDLYSLEMFKVTRV